MKVSGIFFILTLVSFVIYLLSLFWSDAFASLLIADGHRVPTLVAWEISEHLIVVFALLSGFFGVLSSLSLAVEILWPRRPLAG